MIFRSNYFKDENKMKKDKNEAFLYRVDEGRDDGRYKSIIMTISIPEKLAKVWKIPCVKGEYLVKCETVFDTSEISYKYVLYNKYIGKIVSRHYDMAKPENAMDKNLKLELPYYIEHGGKFENPYKEIYSNEYISSPTAPPAIIKISRDDEEKDIYYFSESNLKEGEAITPEWRYGGVYIPETYTEWGVFWKNIPENWKDYTVPDDFHSEIDSIPCDINFWIINEQEVAIPVDHNSREYKEMMSFGLGDGVLFNVSNRDFYEKIENKYIPKDIKIDDVYAKPVLKEDKNGEIEVTLECAINLNKADLVNNEIQYPKENGDCIIGYIDWRKLYGKYEENYISHMDSYVFKEFNDAVEKGFLLGASRKYKEYSAFEKEDVKRKDRKEIHILKVYRDPSKTFPDASVSMVLEIPERLAKMWKIPYNKFTKPMVRVEYSSTVEDGFFRNVDVDFYYYPVEIINKNVVIGEEVKIERDSETYHDMKYYDLNGGYLIKGVDLNVPMEIETKDEKYKETYNLNYLNYTREESNYKYDTDKLYYLTFGTQYYKKYKIENNINGQYCRLKINNEEEMNYSIALSTDRDTPWFEKRFNAGFGYGYEDNDKREIYYSCIPVDKFDEYNKKSEDITGIDL